MGKTRRYQPNEEKKNNRRVKTSSKKKGGGNKRKYTDLGEYNNQALYAN